jgi:hypothetical protein
MLRAANSRTGNDVVPEERGFLEDVLGIFTTPVREINNILSFISSLGKAENAVDANQTAGDERRGLARVINYPIAAQWWSRMNRQG